MKKIFTLCLVAAAAMFANSALAQDDVEMYALVGNSDTKSEIPITIYRTNPTVDICAAEFHLQVNGDYQNFVQDDFGFKYVEGDGWNYRTHNVVIYAGPLGNDGIWADHFWISISGPSNPTMKGAEGAVITVYYNGEDLEPGSYTVNLLPESMLISTLDKYYVSEANTTTFTVSEDGKVTAVGGVTVEAAVAAGKSIYTVGGQKVTAPQKGQIYVVDGKVVKY